LHEQGIEARVVDMFTIKPLDTECVLDCAKRTGAVVTAENHSIYNALGSAVAETLAEGCPAPLERVGIRDEFGEVGSQAELAERFHLTAKEIVERAKAAIGRKA
jgi:transketolase